MMAQQLANVHLGPARRHAFAARRPTGSTYAVGVWIVVAIVIVSVVLLMLAGRERRAEESVGATVDAVSDLGLHLAAEASPLDGPGSGDEPLSTGGPVSNGLGSLDGPGSTGGADPGAAVVPWDSVFEVTVITRRDWRATWFGFEIRTEGHGLVLLDGSRGPGEAFLAECHRFGGFNHIELGEALAKRNSRVICYSR